MDKEEIIHTLIYYNRFFPFMKGDVASIYEKATTVAQEMLLYKDHKLWESVNRLHKQLPNYKKFN